LVEDALRGDAWSGDQLIARLKCVPLIVHQRNLRLGLPLSDDEIKDVTQETLALVWSQLDTYAGRSSLETWVYSYCHHQMMNAIRSKRRRPRLIGEEAADVRTERHSDAPGAAYLFEHVYSGLERLDREQAEVIRLKHFESRTFEEIAAELVLSPNTVKTLYYRGLERLRGLLQRHLREEFA
jgi:RNA polymerase sigma-70 factor (ECF subfamily)